MGVSQRTQKIILAIAMFFNGIITPGGIIYGWPGLSQQLKNSWQYADDCENYSPQTTCSSQDTKLNQIFAVGANVATVATIVYGFTLDRYGVRANAVSVALLMSLGFVLMALSESNGDPFDAFIPGFSLVAFGGLGTYLPAFQFSVLFDRPTRVLSLQSAMFGVAGLTFTFFKYLGEEHDISRKTSFLFYAGLVAFCSLNMLLLYPAKSYRVGDQIHLPVLGWLGLQKPPQSALEVEDQAVVNGRTTSVDAHSLAQADYSPLREEDSNSVSRSTSDVRPRGSSISSIKMVDNTVISMAKQQHGTQDLEASPSPASPGRLDKSLFSPSAAEVARLKQERLVRDLTREEKEIVLFSRGLKEEILNPGTILVALHFSIGLLCCNFYNANISTLLKNWGDADGKMANAFVFITSIYPCFFSLAIDGLQRRFRYAGTSAICTVCLIAGFSFLFLHNQYAQIPAFFLFGTGRALLITVMFSYVAVEYRPDHYGRVIAFVTTLCAIIGLLQLLLQWVLNGPANDNFDYFAGGYLVVLAPLFYFSYWCHKQRV